ncbi:spermatogenesis-associated protein 31D4-like [Grammomys surdaster]|uniref:spermatogenesis-associated protein 31D4-like n=1 Tax=Grammomys surdaster TaxID=491861 RepID=UPI00109FF5F6|nr:spermatogenesis-associated protein 31D4-like [Grammomys surdaster]
MENIFSFLNRYIEPWLGFGSAFLDTGSNYIFLSGVGTILLYLWYLILKPFFPPPWKSQDIKKWQGTANKGRRRSFKGYRTTQRKTQEQKKLLSVVQSPLGELYDSSNFRQLLCPDPFCDVCNGATAKISRLLSQTTLQDGAASMSSMDSTVSVTETSLTLSLPLPENTVGYPISDPTYEPSLQSTTIISPNQNVYLEDTRSALPLGDSLLSESIPPVDDKSPLDCEYSHPLDFLPLPQQHATRETELLLQPTTVLSLVGSPSKLLADVSINNSICSSSYAVSEIIQPQTDTGNSSQLEPAHLVNQELLDLPSSEAYLWGNTTTYLALPGHLHFSSLGAVALLETQDERRTDSLKTWGKTSEFDHQNLAVSHPLGSSNERLHIPQQLSYSCEDQLEDKHTQFFWGLPSLHSESMNSIATVLTDSSLTSGCFNRFSDSPMLTLHPPLPLPENQLYNLSQSLSQSQFQHVPQANPQAQLQPPIPVLSPSHSQLRICGVYFHSPQGEAQLLVPSAIHCLEYNILKKEQERVWGLPTVVKNSQQKFCPPPPNPSLVSHPSKTHIPMSIFLENCFITNELRKKFEHHLRKRLILQRWGLPKRIRESLLWMNPQAELPKSPSSKSNYGLSWISCFKQQGRKDLHNTGDFPAKQLEKKLLKTRGYNLETVQKQQTWSNTRGTLDNGLKSDFETNLQCHSDSLPCKPLGTSEVSQCQKKLETSLKEHLTTHLNETNEGQINSAMSRSRHGPFPFTSCVNKEEHKAQKLSDNMDGHVKSISTVKKSVMQQTSFVLNNTSLEESKGKRHSSDVPRMLAEVGSVPLVKRLHSGKTVQGPQVTKMIDKKVFVSKKLGKGGQLSGLQPCSTKILNINQCKSAKGTDANTTKAQNTLLAGRA